jgi:hypothetical protein
MDKKYIVLYKPGTVGIYGQDADGNNWTTFGPGGGGIGSMYTCAECGAQIDRGWMRGGRATHADFFCPELHVTYKPGPVEAPKPDLTGSVARYIEAAARVWKHKPATTRFYTACDKRGEAYTRMDDARKAWDLTWTRMYEIFPDLAVQTVIGNLPEMTA